MLVGQEIYYIDDNFVNGACSYNVLWAYLVDVVLDPGTYYIVVDGYGGQVGNYGISVEESPSDVNNNNNNNITHLKCNLIKK